MPAEDRVSPPPDGGALLPKSRALVIGMMMAAWVTLWPAYTKGWLKRSDLT